MKLRTLRSSRSSDATEGRVTVRMEPPERRRRPPTLLSGACGATSSTSTTSSLHSVGGLIGAAVGAKRAAKAHGPEATDDRGVVWRATALYCIVLILCAAVTPLLLSTRHGGVAVFLMLPAVQLAASIVAAMLALVLFRSPRSRTVAFNAVATITGYALLWALGGAVITVPIVLFLLN